MKSTITLPPLRTFCMAGSAAALLAACAGSSDKYPSLAIRDAERQLGAITPAASTGTAVEPVASGQDIAAIVERATSADAAFREARPQAARLAQAARESGVESNDYARAAAALATLSALRGQTVAALGSLDELETEAATTFAPLGEIRAAQTRIEALVEEQTAVMTSLSAGLER